METPFFMDGMYVMGEIREFSALTAEEQAALIARVGNLEIPTEHLALVPMARVTVGGVFVTVESLVIDKRKISARGLGRYTLTTNLPFGELKQDPDSRRHDP